MAEGVLRPDSLAVGPAGARLAVHLPWYRALPVSCLETIAVELADTEVEVTVPADAGSTWDLRAPLTLGLGDVGLTVGDRVSTRVVIDLRIPYLESRPGVPVVQRTEVEAPLTARRTVERSHP